MIVNTTNTYECEFCHHVYNTSREAHECELACTGLSEKGLHTWWNLRCDTSRKDVDVAELIRFEKVHSVTPADLKEKIATRWQKENNNG